MPMQLIKAAFHLTSLPPKVKFSIIIFFVEKTAAYPLLLGCMAFQLSRKVLLMGNTHLHCCRNLCLSGRKIHLGLLGLGNVVHLGSNIHRCYHTSTYKQLHGFTQIFVSGQQTSPLEHVVSEAHERFVGVRHCLHLDNNIGLVTYMVV